MDFSRVELSAEDAALRTEIRAVLAEHLTEENRDRIRQTKTKFYEPLCLALGERGWILPERSPEEGGAGLTPFQCHLLKLELDRWNAPLEPLGTTRLILMAVEADGQPDVVRELVPEVAAGRARFALGYTEPDHGSDIAAAETFAVRDGDEWVINGTKKFTTHAQYCQYTFLLTRTNTDVKKHRGLTMFILPLDLEGVEIVPIITIGDERTNLVHYRNVRVHDRYRLGEVDGGWQVILAPLNAEHGHRDDEPRTIGPVPATGTISLNALQQAFEHAVAWAQGTGNGDAPLDDPIVRTQLAQVAIDLETGVTAPDPFGRVYAASTYIERSSNLMTLVGPEAVVHGNSPGALQFGAFEYYHRFSPGTSIYGGTVEVFKNIIAQHVLGLPRQLPPSA
jgi:alkylation response protein AidB-like acyl-CoA dehydrogenase